MSSDPRAGETDECVERPPCNECGKSTGAFTVCESCWRELHTSPGDCLNCATAEQIIKALHHTAARLAPPEPGPGCPKCGGLGAHWGTCSGPVPGAGAIPPVEAIRTSEAVRDAFVDCYTAQDIFGDGIRMRPVSDEALERCDEVERVLVAAVVRAALSAGPPPDAPDPLAVLGRGLAAACAANDVRAGEIVQFQMVPHIWEAYQAALRASPPLPNTEKS